MIEREEAGRSQRGAIESPHGLGPHQRSAAQSRSGCCSSSLRRRLPLRAAHGGGVPWTAASPYRLVIEASSDCSSRRFAGYRITSTDTDRCVWARISPRLVSIDSTISHGVARNAAVQSCTRAVHSCTQAVHSGTLFNRVQGIRLIGCMLRVSEFFGNW